MRVHEEAVQRGEHTYIDPVTGALVMTELAHASRGFCCGNGCRHCPWKTVLPTGMNRTPGQDN